MAQKHSLSILILLVGILVAAYLLYDFHSTKIPELDGRVRAAQGQLDVREAELKRLEAFAQNIEGVKQELRELNLQFEAALESMPRSFNLSGLLRKLNLLAQNSGVEMSSFKPHTSVAPAAPGAEAEHTFYSPISIEFTLRGSFTQTMVFFDQVSRLKRIVNINSLKLRPSLANVGAKTSTAVLTTDAAIETYRYAE